jgi:hypothetical protein
MAPNGRAASLRTGRSGRAPSERRVARPGQALRRHRHRVRQPDQAASANSRSEPCLFFLVCGRAPRLSITAELSGDRRTAVSIHRDSARKSPVHDKKPHRIGATGSVAGLGPATWGRRGLADSWDVDNGAAPQISVTGASAAHGCADPPPAMCRISDIWHLAAGPLPYPAVRFVDQALAGKRKKRSKGE